MHLIIQENASKKKKIKHNEYRVCSLHSPGVTHFLLWLDNEMENDKRSNGVDIRWIMTVTWDFKLFWPTIYLHH